MRRKIIVLGLVVVTGIGVALWYQQHRRAASENHPVLVLYGNVDVRRVHLGFRVPGRLSAMLTEEGEVLEPNAVVARLDAEPYQHELHRARAEQDQAAAALARLENGARPQEVEQAQALVREREATLKTLRVEYERTSALISDHAVTQQAFDDISARRDEAEARLQAAQAAMALIHEGPRSEDIAAARARLAQVQAVVAQAERRLRDTVLRAPSSGILLTRVEEPGAMVATGQTVAVMSLTQPVWVRTYIAEPDLGRVWLGMPAEIVTDTHPGQSYPGHVGFISPEAEFTPKNVQTPYLRTDLVFRLRIVVDPPDTGLCQGMPVTVHLQTSPEKTTRVEE